MERLQEDGENYGGVKYKLRHFGKFKVLLIVTVLFIVLSLIFIILFVVEKSKTNEPALPEKPKVQTYCGTMDCLRASLDTLKQLNQSADPCTDFYEYACGGWEHEHALRPGVTALTSFSLVAWKSYNVLKRSLENAKKNYSNNEAVMKTVKFYNVCIDAAAVEARGDRPLKKLIDDMGGWNVTGNMTSISSMSITERIGKVSSELFVKPFIDVKVSIDLHDSNKHILQFGSGELGMLRSYYTKESYSEVREAYKTYMKKIAKLLGGGPDSDEQMMKVYELEAQLAVLDEDDKASSIIEALKKKFPPGVATMEITSTLQEFSVKSKVDLNELVTLANAVFKKKGRTFKKDDKVLVFPVEYYTKLFNFYKNVTKTDPVVVVNYIMWSVIRNFIKAMPQRYIDAYYDYAVTVTGNSTSLRWIVCINKMQKVFGMPLGLLFVDAAFDESSKETVTQMTTLVKDEFIKNLDTLPWMSEQTKRNAIEKANAIAEDIGYPSYIKNPTELAAKLKDLKVGNKLFENVRHAFSFVADKEYGSLDERVDRDQWLMSPSQVNGYNAFRQNRIVFLAAILQPPFYNPTYPKYFNFGGIGMVIGHEITHGFDGNGRFFDKNGNVNNWWSPTSLHGFLTNAQCLVNQYSDFEVFGKKINGNQTLNENIADNGGIKLAFQAYKTLVGKEGTEGALPGLGLTEEQLFFVGFARVWCSLYKKKAALRQLETDPHSFEKYRMIGTLHNYDKFAKAFNCKPGAPMNPEKKCTLW